MSLLAIAYSQEDLSAAQRIAAAVEADIEFEHYPVGRANDGELLVDILRKNRLPTVLLVSDSLLTNPNAMQGLTGVLDRTEDLLPIIIDAHRPDPDTGEIITVHTSLESRADVMQYLSHWQDRYIELRRGGEDYTDAVSQHAFKAYLRRIRQTSIGVEESLERLLEWDGLRDENLRAENYAPLYQLAKTEKPAAGTPEAMPTKPKLNRAIHAGAAVVERGEADDPEAPAPAEPAEQVIDRAWRMADAGNATEALEELADALEDTPENDDLQYQYALMLALGGENLWEADRQVDALLQRRPDHAEGRFLAGELNLAAGRYRRARQDWEHLADLQPNYPELSQRLGLLLVEHFPADVREAGSYLARAVKESQASGEVFYRYGELLAGPLDRPKRARKMLQRAIAADPEHAPAHYRLAVLEFDRGNLQLAKKNYLLAVSLEPAYDTPANRRAFHAAPPVAAAPRKTAEAPTDALTALKRNIADLEAMLSDRQPREKNDGLARPGSNKTVLLTGATSGIGLATARRLARDGYRLILVGRRETRLREVGQELAAGEAIEVHLLPLDVSRRERVGEAIAGLPRDWQQIDLLINNAGKAKGFDPIHAGNLDHWDEMIDVNLRGLLYLTRAVTPGMVKRKRGMVINVASTAGKEVYPNGNVYCATKHAVDALTYAMRLDLVQYGIRVGQICPAHVEETEFALVRFDGDRERARIYNDFQPLRSSDVAEAIHFMVSQPAHVNVLDMVIQGTQQASSTVVDRSGRARFAPEEEE